MKLLTKKGRETMKKLVVLTMVVALFIGIPFCVFAQEERRDASKLCKEAEVAIAVYGNLGQCVSYLQTCVEESGHSTEWCMCRAMRIVDPDGYRAAYNSMGLAPCIAVLRDMYY